MNSLLAVGRVRKKRQHPRRRHVWLCALPTTATVRLSISFRVINLRGLVPVLVSCAPLLVLALVPDSCAGLVPDLCVLVPDTCAPEWSFLWRALVPVLVRALQLILQTLTHRSSEKRAARQLSGDPNP